MTEGEKEVLLKIDKLEVVYHNVSIAIQGVSLMVMERQIVTLLGTNGAGKTTTLRAVSGFLGVDDAKVTEGFIAFRGEQIQNKPPDAIARKGIILVPEQDKVFDNLTVEENLQVCESLRGSQIDRQEMVERVFHYFPILKGVRHRLGGYLSGGERQMLSLSTALLCNPQLLLVDELSLGLAPLIIEELMKLVKVIRNEQDVTVFLVEQNALAALEIADYGYVIENGRIVFDGDPDRLRNHQDIQEFYLGQGERESQKSYRDVKQYRRTRRWYG